MRNDQSTRHAANAAEVTIEVKAFCLHEALDARQPDAGRYLFQRRRVEVIKHYVRMTPDEMNEAAEAMAVLIVAHIKANRQRAAEAKRNDQFNQPNQNTDDRSQGAISDD